MGSLSSIVRLWKFEQTQKVQPSRFQFILKWLLLVCLHSTSNSGYDVIQNAITISSNASQGGVSLEPDLRGQIAPGGSIVYTHTLKPWGTSVLSATDNFGDFANDRTGFTTTLYYDANNDGQLDASDPIIQNLSIVNAAILSSKSPIRILIKLSSHNTVGVANTSVISLKK